MNLTVYPGSAEGIVAALPSATEALQAIILAAITRTGVRNPGNSDEIEELLNALYKMGARYRKQNNVILFYESVKQGSAEIKCGINVAMLLFPLCMSVGCEYTFTPNSIRVIEDMYSLTSEIQINKSIRVRDKRLLPGMLLSLPLREDIIIYEGSPKDAQLSLYILGKFGYSISEKGGYSIKKDRSENPDYIYSVGGDYSDAVFLFLPGFLSGEVGVTGLLADSMQPEKSILEELKGLRLSIQEMNGAVFAKKSRIGAEVIDIKNAVEPSVLLCLCSFSKAKCVIKNIDLLQHNKREEFEHTVNGLKSIGADIMPIGTDLLISGARILFGGTADARGSRKLSLVFAAAALCSETGVTIKNCTDLKELMMLGISL